MAREKATKEEALTIPPHPVEIVPAWVVPSPLGIENIRTEDSRVPRLSIAQSNSPQVIKGDPKFIPGLTNGDAFNDLTEEIYGDRSLQVIVIRADKPRWIEFDDKRKIVDREVKAGDSRTLWTSDPISKKRIPPIATQFFDYVVLILPRMEPVALSFKSTGIETAMKLNGLIRSKTAPIFACKYELTPKQFSNDQGTWTNFTVRQLGWAEQEEYLKAEKFFTIFKEKTVEFDEGHDETEEESTEL